MSDHEWNVKCGAAILAVYATIKMCNGLKLDPHDLMQLVLDNVPKFQLAEDYAQEKKR